MFETAGSGAVKTAAARVARKPAEFPTLSAGLGAVNVAAAQFAVTLAFSNGGDGRVRTGEPARCRDRSE